MKKKMFIIGAALGLTLAYAGGASAHQHYIETPTGNHVLLPQEPTQVHEGVHPLHNNLHMGPANEERAISIGVAISDGEDGLMDRTTKEAVNPINVK